MTAKKQVKKDEEEEWIRLHTARWLEYVLVKTDTDWHYVVGIEQRGEEPKFIRIAWGKLTNNKQSPITQINRIKFKDKKSWDEIKVLVDKYFEVLINEPFVKQEVKL